MLLGVGVTGGHHLLGALAAEGGEEACSKAVDVFRPDVDMGGAVLGSDGDDRRWCWLRISAGGERRRAEDDKET